MTLPSQPYVYNSTSEVMVSFDDAISFGMLLLRFYGE
jgi:GH18 family chitinase